jgi:hypothetical protein
MNISNLDKKMSHIIFTPSLIMILFLGSGMLNAVPGNSQLISENAGAPIMPFSPTSSANQSGILRSLQASELVTFEAQSNQSFVNQSIISKLREATGESFETFDIPTTNRNVSGPESIGSQSSLSDNIGTPDSQSAQMSDTLPPSIGNTDVFGNMSIPQQVEEDMLGNISIPMPPTPSTMIDSHKIDGVPSNLKGVTGETSMAANNDLIFYTGNWYAARSTDAGKTWQYINASEDFEQFCCDQRVLYDAAHNLFIWYRQGFSDEATNENTLRIGISDDALTWRMFDIIPSSLGDIFVKTWFDYPEIAITDNNLYITTNAFTDRYPLPELLSAVIMRISLDDIGRGVFDLEYYRNPETFTFTPVQGAKDKMYWATHLTNDIMRIYEWTDGLPSTSIKIYDRQIDPWFTLSKGVGKCAPLTAVEGAVYLEGNWCDRTDSRITSGWISGTQIGFFWNADAGSTTARGATFPWPYINAATFDISNNMSYVGRPYIWNDDFPWLFASAAVNENGEVGVVAYHGQPGAVNIPGIAIGVRNQLDRAEAWNMTSLAVSSTPPDLLGYCGERGVVHEQCTLPSLAAFSYEWGDYITIRSHNGPSADWDVAAFIAEEDVDEEGNEIVIREPYYFRISNTS